MESKEEFETAVLVKNIASKKQILDYGYRFLAGKGYGKLYRLQNSKTEINFIVHNSKIAYELMKHFEEGKQTEKALKEIEVQLTMIPKGSYSETSYEDNTTNKNNTNSKNKFNKNNTHKISATLKASIQKDEDYRMIPYFQRHTKEVGANAGVIASDSPYITDVEIRRLEEKESRKKDISNIKFTSVLPKYPHNNDGLDTIPIGNTEGYQFRGEDKKKWISKRGFQVYG